MIVEGIISVAGKPGLYKVVGQTKNGVIVEGLADNKRLAMNSSSKMSALQDIAIYTYTEEIPLVDVLDMIRLKEAGKPSIGHKSSSNVLLSYFREILKDFDEDRVYPSDIKKVISWYNTLQKAGLAIETVEEKDEAVEKTKPKAKAKAKSKTKEAEEKPKAKAKAKAKSKTKEAEEKPKAKAKTKPKAKKE